jgi:hypothetical protein
MDPVRTSRVSFFEVEAFDFAVKKFFGAMGGMWRQVAGGMNSVHISAEIQKSPLLIRYILVRASIFNQESLLYRFIGTLCSEQESNEVRSHVAVLCAISKTLYELRDDWEQRAGTLSKPSTLNKHTIIEMLSRIKKLFPPKEIDDFVGLPRYFRKDSEIGIRRW